MACGGKNVIETKKSELKQKNPKIWYFWKIFQEFIVGGRNLSNSKLEIVISKHKAHKVLHYNAHDIFPVFTEPCKTIAVFKVKFICQGYPE